MKYILRRPKHKYVLPGGDSYHHQQWSQQSNESV